MKTKVLALPNYFCGVVVNYYIEFYMSEYVCTYSGVPARCGSYHEQPRYAERYSKKPFHSTYVTPEQLEQLKLDYIVEVIQ